MRGIVLSELREGQGNDRSLMLIRNTHIFIHLCGSKRTNIQNKIHWRIRRDICLREHAFLIKIFIFLEATNHIFERLLPSIHLSIHPSIHLFLCLSIHFSVQNYCTYSIRNKYYWWRYLIDDSEYDLRAVERSGGPPSDLLFSLIFFVFCFFFLFFSFLFFFFFFFSLRGPFRAPL